MPQTGKRQPFARQKDARLIDACDQVVSMASPPPRGPLSLRLLAGFSAGIAGGLLFGFVMLGEVISRVAILNDIGILPFAVNTDGGMATWLAHLGMSALFGLVFAAVVGSRSLRVTVPAALAFSIALWALGGSFGVAALAGHLLFGAGLGVVYPLLWREELSMLHPDATRAG